MKFFIVSLPVLFVSIFIFARVLTNPMRKKIAGLNGRPLGLTGGVIDIDGKEVCLDFEQGSKGKSPLLKFWMKGDFSRRLVIRKENGFDRFCKNIGLTGECKTTDPAFNDAFYFECDDPQFLGKMFAQQKSRDLVRGALDHFVSIEITPTTCLLRLRPNKHLDKYTDEEVRHLARTVLDITKIIPQDTGAPEGAAKAFVLRLTVLLTVSIILLVAGIGVWIYAEVHYRIIEGGRLWSLVLPWWVAAFVCWQWFSFMLIKGFSRSGLAFVMCFLFSFAGSLLLARYGAAVYNGFKDVSPIAAYQAIAVDKYYHTNKHSRSFYVFLSPWQEGRGPYELSVQWGDYQATQSGVTRYQVQTKSGIMGLEWLVSYQRLPSL